MCTLNTIIFCLKLNTINLIVACVIVKTRVDGIWRSWSRWRLGWCVWSLVCVFDAPADLHYDNFILQMKHVILTIRVQIILLDLSES